MKAFTRRLFLKLSSLTSIMLFPHIFFKKIQFLSKLSHSGTITISHSAESSTKGPINQNSSKSREYLGISEDGFSHIYLSRKGTPEQNMAKILEMMGGIENLIGKNDIVILKPNAQWWNQGGTNTEAMKKFIELVLNLSNFKGEVIIAENHHLNPANSRGWTQQEYNNGMYNLNDLVNYFNERGKPNVTKYHWIDAETEKYQKYSLNGVVRGPEDGDGYVWMKDNIYQTPEGRKAMMSYPIFTSFYSGITIDLMKGAWKGGKYLNIPVKLINFSALNHHGKAFGVTASIKNHLGIVDLTCGYPGKTLKSLLKYNYFNFHYIGCGPNSRIFNKANHILARYLRRRTHLGWSHNYSYLGRAIGRFLKSVHMSDLNIITAEWVGYGSRLDLNLRAQTKTILASLDPISLDYYAAKNILLPATKNAPNAKKYIQLNDPTLPKSPFRKVLEECHKEGIGTLNEKKMIIHEYDFSRAQRL